MANLIGTGSNVKGGSFEGYDGTLFTFTPTVGISAQKAFALSNSIKSMRVPLEASVREVVRPSISENFQVGGRPKWAPLTEATVKRKGSPKINIASGRLARVAQQRNIWDITRTTAVIRGGELLGRVPYALFVQAGHANHHATQGEKVSIRNAMTGKVTTLISEGADTPPRPYLMIQPEDVVKIQKIFATWLDTRIGTHWR